jgi:hypothetical protein
VDKAVLFSRYRGWRGVLGVLWAGGCCAACAVGAWNGLDGVGPAGSGGRPGVIFFSVAGLIEAQIRDCMAYLAGPQSVPR